MRGSDQVEGTNLLRRCRTTGVENRPDQPAINRDTTPSLMTDLTPLLDRLPAASRTRIERAMRDADREILAARDVSTPLDTSSGPVVILGLPSTDRAAADWVLTVFEVVVSVEADRMTREVWLDQLIDWSYGRHHSGNVPLETFARSTYQMVVMRPWWRDVQVHGPAPAVREEVPAPRRRGRKPAKVKFGTQLRRLREEARLTVERLADETRLDKTTVMAHEQNKYKARPQTVTKYEAALARVLKRDVKFDL